MFGNPGTVEQGFLDALERLPGLQVHPDAAGDDRRRRSPTATPAPPGGRPLVQLHSGVGLGNGIGMLYQAKRGHAPLVVIAGEPGIRYDAMDAQMAADLVAMAKPVTKWATRVVDPSSVLRVLRRAIKIAAHAADGPGLRRACRWTCSTRPTTRRSCRRRSRHARRCRRPDVGPRGGRDAGRRRAADRSSSATASRSPARRPSWRAWPSCSAPRSGARTRPRSTSRYDPSALPRLARAHVRRPQPARSRRRPTSS